MLREWLQVRAQHRAHVLEGSTVAALGVKNFKFFSKKKSFFLFLCEGSTAAAASWHVSSSGSSKVLIELRVVKPPSADTIKPY